MEIKVAHATSADLADQATGLTVTLDINKGGTGATTAAKALENLGGLPSARKINNKELTKDITLTASDVGARPSNWMPSAADVGARPSNWMPSAADVGAVPISRKINDKELSSDIRLAASDVGARPSTWTPTASDVGAVPTTRKINGKELSSDITLSASDIGVTSGGCETADP